MHRGPQNGAWSGCSGLPQIGQLLSDRFGISTGHGNGGIGPQPDRAANLARQRLGPLGFSFEHLNHGRMCGQAQCARPLGRGPSQQRARFERSTILRQLDERRALARPHDLDEAEAVYGRALERLR